MKYRIFITGSGISSKAEKLLGQEGCIIEVGTPNDTADDIAEKVLRFQPDGLIVRQGKITAGLMDAAKNLKVISKHGVGTDNIEIDEATRRGIPVFYTPKANYNAVAEHTMALILSLTRQIPENNQKIRNGLFDKIGYDGFELSGKTVGLIGFGNVARRLVQLLEPFNVTVLAFHPSNSNENMFAFVRKVNRLEEIFIASDIISIHCPLTEKTSGLVNRKTISLMKKTVRIINTSRGGIIIEKDLINALQIDRILGAALDVFENEPVDSNNPLLKMKNVIVSPHIAGLSDLSYDNMGICSVKNVISVLKNQDIDFDSLINGKVLSSRP